MTIEFQCEKCEKVLRTSDDKAGRTARCPQCGNSITVPAGESNEFDEFPADDDEFGDFGGPPPLHSGSRQTQITCPMCGEVNAGSSSHCQSCGESLAGVAATAGRGGSTDFGDIWNRAWEVWSKNLGINVGAAAIYFGITIGVNFMLGFISQLLLIGVVGAGGNNPGGGAAATMLGVQFFQNLISTLLGWYLTIGFAQFAIDNNRSENPSLESLFLKGSRILPVLGTMFCYTVLIGLCAIPGGVLIGVGVATADPGAGGGFPVLIFVGLAVALIGAFIAAVLLWSVPFMLADRSSGYLASLSDAFQIGRAYPGLSLIVVLVNIGLSIAGVMACCVGLLFAFPLSYAVMAVAYDRCRLSVNR